MTYENVRKRVRPHCRQTTDLTILVYSYQLAHLQHLYFLLFWLPNYSNQIILIQQLVERLFLVYLNYHNFGTIFQDLGDGFDLVERCLLVFDWRVN